MLREPRRQAQHWQERDGSWAMFYKASNSAGRTLQCDCALDKLKGATKFQNTRKLNNLKITAIFA